MRMKRIESILKEEILLLKKVVNEAKKRIIKLKPGSDEYVLKSIIFRNHNGQYNRYSESNQ